MLNHPYIIKLINKKLFFFDNIYKFIYLCA